MSRGLCGALLWGGVAVVAAALNLVTGTACCKARYHRPAAEWRRPLTPPRQETEPNDDERTPMFLGDVRDDFRYRFEGTCAGGSRDVFHIGVAQGMVGVVCEITGAPGAMLVSPQLGGVRAGVKDGRIELSLPRDHTGGSVYLEIPCAPDGGRYEGWYTAMRPPR